MLHSERVVSFMRAGRSIALASARKRGKVVFILSPDAMDHFGAVCGREDGHCCNMMFCVVQNVI